MQGAEHLVPFYRLCSQLAQHCNSPPAAAAQKMRWLAALPAMPARQAAAESGRLPADSLLPCPPWPALPLCLLQKTDVRSGVIVSAEPAAGSSAAPEQQPAKRQRAASFNRPPTKVVLLTNMVSEGSGGWGMGVRLHKSRRCTAAATLLGLRHRWR